jgi:hypothetical protein
VSCNAKAIYDTNYDTNTEARKILLNRSNGQNMAKLVSSLLAVKAWPWLVKTGTGRGLSNDRALAELKTGAYIVAYRREN